MPVALNNSYNWPSHKNEHIPKGRLNIGDILVIDSLNYQYHHKNHYHHNHVSTENGTLLLNAACRLTSLDGERVPRVSSPEGLQHLTQTQ